MATVPLTDGVTDAVWLLVIVEEMVPVAVPVMAAVSLGVFHLLTVIVKAAVFELV
jgi:hypothetical protein